ncbi:hypothetical protein OIU34_18545 [Pararhizobium sp. BT-229]|uniref:hypothetical protein n=1 Tax=Pararhizobium sp. BT-229 TaxID=2986923 RepID=UPI0021F71DE3|nr:hypothetical protein [Pararhizobium sp. BT-229]MCV9963879.1 hypothetical protein [Pararhizobium sp. BT-229]
MNVVEEFSGVFLRLSLETREEQQRYREAYQDACYSGMQVQQTAADPQPDGSQLVGIWLDERLVEPLRASIETGHSLKSLLARETVTRAADGQPRL